VTDLSRRDMLSSAAALGALAVLGVRDANAAAPVRQPSSGRIKQSVARWCYDAIPLPTLCTAAKQMGLVGIDLLQSSDWDAVNNAGLLCTMGYASDRADFLHNGFTNRASHTMLLGEYERALPLAKAKGVPNMIAMFGDRDGRSDAEAIAAATDGLKKLAPMAEQAGVTICVELLNSKVDHKGYQGDHTAFGVAVVSAVNSPRVKLLYDIYHMQIMEGDIIRTIRANSQYIGHYHTGGVPGRHELDDTQELDWRGIMRAIADTGYTGYVAHEFIPTRDPLTSLREAVVLCDV